MQDSKFIKKAVICNRVIDLAIIESLFKNGFSNLVAPKDTEKEIKANSLLSKFKFFFFESDFELFDTLVFEEFSIVAVFGHVSWSIPFPVPHFRFILNSQSPEFTQANKEMLSTMFRRSKFILSDISKFTQHVNIPIGSFNQITEFSLASDLISSMLESISSASGNDFYPELNSMVPKVQIVTPSYNHAGYIEKTIKSVLEQDYQNLHYKITDGGSKDNTTEILKKYESRLSWISEKDRGYADAVNKGLLLSDADYFCWLPSDDLLFDKHSISRLVSHAMKTKADIVFADAVYCDDNEKTNGIYATEEYNVERFKENCFICQPATVFSGKAYNAVGGLDIKYKSIADYELWLRFTDLNLKFERAGFPGARYRLHGSSITVSQRILTYYEIFSLELKKYGRVGNNWVLGAMNEIIGRRIPPVKAAKISIFSWLRYWKQVLVFTTKNTMLYFLKYTALRSSVGQKIVLQYLHSSLKRGTK